MSRSPDGLRCRPRQPLPYQLTRFSWWQTAATAHRFSSTHWKPEPTCWCACAATGSSSALLQRPSGHDAAILAGIGSGSLWMTRPPSRPQMWRRHGRSLTGEGEPLSTTFRRGGRCGVNGTCRCTCVRSPSFGSGSPRQKGKCSIHGRFGWLYLALSGMNGSCRWWWRHTFSAPIRSKRTGLGSEISWQRPIKHCRLATKSAGGAFSSWLCFSYGWRWMCPGGCFGCGSGISTSGKEVAMKGCRCLLLKSSGTLSE